MPWVAMAGNHDHDGNVYAQVEFGLTEPLWYFPNLYYTFTTVTIEILIIELYRAYGIFVEYFCKKNGI